MKTNQEINEAIAEKCGWKRIRLGTQSQNDTEPKGWLPPTTNDWRHGRDRCPNYCSDLNAMHEAEKTVDRELYVAQLLAVIHEVDADYFHKITWQHGYELTTATARQRAIAFCRTVGIEID